MANGWPVPIQSLTQSGTALDTEPYQTRSLILRSPAEPGVSKDPATSFRGARLKAGNDFLLRLRALSLS